MTKLYFPNLNGIRFIAAFLVIIHHVEQIKHLIGMDSNWDNPTIAIIGKLGVILFFVLSGFLITYLLLVEEGDSQTIRVKDFYIRRVLRIWPLYYLVVAVSFLVLNQLDFFYVGKWSDAFSQGIVAKALLFTLFLPNLAIILFPPVMYASQAWSVGVEEQFYLIWPILMKYVKKKAILLLSIAISIPLLNIFVFPAIESAGYTHRYIHYLASFVQSFSINCMAIGGILALVLFNKYKLLNVLFSKWVQTVVLTAIVLLIAMGVHIPYLHYEVYAILFGIFILNMAANPKPLFTLEQPGLHYLGKISYGLYMYHPFCIFVSVKLLMVAGIDSTIFQYIASLLFTVLLAGLSYKYFEHYFIAKKIGYSTVVSGDNAKNG